MIEYLQTINVFLNLLIVTGLILLHVTFDYRRRQIVRRLDHILDYTKQIPEVKEEVKEIALDQKTNNINPGTTTPTDNSGSKL